LLLSAPQRKYAALRLNGCGTTLTQGDVYALV
jgi:hypothetical protein